MNLFISIFQIRKVQDPSKKRKQPKSKRQNTQNLLETDLCDEIHSGFHHTTNQYTD
jgi:hypothetical protein